jgi:hypothetical protein
MDTEFTNVESDFVKKDTSYSNSDIVRYIPKKNNKKQLIH